MVPYITSLSALGAVGFLYGLFTHVELLTLHQYLYVLIWSAGLHFIYKEKWNNAIVTSAIVIFLVFIITNLTDFYITRNYDLSVPSDFCRYMASNLLGAPVITVFIAALLKRGKVSEAYRIFLSDEHEKRGWRVLILLLPFIHNAMIYFVNEYK